MKKLAEFRIAVEVAAAFEHEVEGFVEVFAGGFEMAGFVVLLAGGEFFFDAADKAFVVDGRGKIVSVAHGKRRSARATAWSDGQLGQAGTARPAGFAVLSRQRRFAGPGESWGRGFARSCAWRSHRSRSLPEKRPGKRQGPRRWKTIRASRVGTSSLGDLRLTMVRSGMEGGQRVRGTGWAEAGTGGWREGITEIGEKIAEQMAQRGPRGGARSAVTVA